MCGLVGIVSRHSSNLELTGLLQQMLVRIKHRGPDSSAQSILTTPCGLVGFGHARLAIHDLSPAGAQPMAHKDWTIVFNGEIYNYLALREELESYCIPWKGNSDTEVLVATIQQFGFENAISRLKGMFAIAAYDHSQNKLWLARDRVGEKPLYYGEVMLNGGPSLVFASELTAIESIAALTISRDAVGNLLRNNYIPSPLSIYTQIQKLAPGSLVCFDLSLTATPLAWPTPVSYWNLADSAVSLQDTLQYPDDASAVGATDTLLRQVIKEQMASDVPLGAFLSGGVDSSLVVALMQAQSSSKINTFTIGFTEPDYDEAPFAREVARILGTNHTELYVSGADALALVPEMATTYDEPFADSSQLPTTLVCQLAKSKVTVSLSGDGGDEFFGGYSRYFLTNSLRKKIFLVPLRIRLLVGDAMRAFSPSKWDLFLKIVGLKRSQASYKLTGDRIHKLANIIGATSESDLYAKFNGLWPYPEQVVLGITASSILDFISLPDSMPFLAKMMVQDASVYLPDDLMVKIDRASMSVSLEARAPLLDVRVVEHALSLPMQYKVRGSAGKWILKAMLAQYIPAKLINRPKTGFGIPIHDWLRGPLREWAGDLLSQDSLRKSGLLDPAAVNKVWLEHLSGNRAWGYQLWGVLMLQAWLQHRTGA